MTPRGKPARPGRLTVTPGKVPTVDIGGRSFADADEATIIGLVLAALARGDGGWVCPVNVDVLRQCRLSSQIAALVDGADLVVADGAPLVWASALQGQLLPGRVAGSTLLLSLSREAARCGRSVFLLGGSPGSAELAAVRLQRDDPDLRIAGVHCPPFGFEADSAEMADLERKLLDASPDIVFVGLGFPKQDRLIVGLRDHMPATWFVSSGISFSFAAGLVRRAPRWIQVVGLEWVHRLAQEPRRLFVRYVIYDIPFALRLLASSTGRRLGSRRRR